MKTIRNRPSAGHTGWTIALLYSLLANLLLAPSLALSEGITEDNLSAMSQEAEQTGEPETEASSETEATSEEEGPEPDEAALQDLEAAQAALDKLKNVAAAAGEKDISELLNDDKVAQALVTLARKVKANGGTVSAQDLKDLQKILIEDEDVRTQKGLPTNEITKSIVIRDIGDKLVVIIKPPGVDQFQIVFISENRIGAGAQPREEYPVSNAQRENDQSLVPRELTGTRFHYGGRSNPKTGIRQVTGTSPVTRTFRVAGLFPHEINVDYHLRLNEDLQVTLTLALFLQFLPFTGPLWRALDAVDEYRFGNGSVWGLLYKVGKESVHFVVDVVFFIPGAMGLPWMVRVAHVGTGGLLLAEVAELGVRVAKKEGVTLGDVVALSLYSLAFWSLGKRLEKMLREKPLTAEELKLITDINQSRLVKDAITRSSNFISQVLGRNVAPVQNYSAVLEFINKMTERLRGLFQKVRAGGKLTQEEVEWAVRAKATFEDLSEAWRQSLDQATRTGTKPILTLPSR